MIPHRDAIGQVVGRLMSMDEGMDAHRMAEQPRFLPFYVR